MRPLPRAVPRARARAAGAAVAALLLPALLTGCTGDDSSDKGQRPADVLADAKATLDETSGVHLTLDSGGLPQGVDGLVSADGVLTHAPAFDGEIVVRYLGFEPRVPLVAVDGKVYAQLPLTTGWQDIDPAEYGAPDPAALIATDGGLSDLLTATQDVAEGESVRGGTDNKEVLTSYTGTLPESAVSGVFPSATGDFDATYTVTDGGELRTAELTGAFYGGAGSDQQVTYTVTLDDYGTDREITAP